MTERERVRGIISGWSHEKDEERREESYKYSHEKYEERRERERERNCLKIYMRKMRKGERERGRETV